MQRNQALRRSRRHVPEGFYFLLEGQPHPLLIPSIIDEVATYLPLEDLKNFTRVCKSWNEEASKKIRKRSKVLINDQDRVTEFMKVYQSTPKNTLPISYELRDVELSSPVVVKFFESFGENVDFVYFNRVRWMGEDLKKILFTLLPNLTMLAVEARAYSDRRLFSDDNQLEILPKITALKLNVFSFITEMTTPFLRDLLRACVNLKKISSLRTEKRNPLPMQFIQYVCHQMSYDTADDVVNMPYTSDISICEALIDTKDVCLPNLSILDCNLRLRAAGLQHFGAKNFPVRELDMTLMCDVSTTVFHSALTRLENTLNVLKVKFHPRCPVAESTFPPLKNLKSLTLNGYRHSLQFLRNLPKLKCLTLIRLYFGRAITQDRIEFNFQSQLESLEIYEDFSKKLRRSTVNHLIRLFPCLKRLKLENLTDDAISEIFTGYKQLTELNGMNGFYSDSSITGIRNINSNNSVDLYGEMERRGSWIGDLQNLQKLSLGSPKLTDAAVLHGIVNCRSLRNLHLLTSNITDVSVTKILENLDLFHLKTEHSYKLSRELKEYATTKMKGRLININDYEGPLKQSEIPKFMRRNGSARVKINKISIGSSGRIKVK